MNHDTITIVAVVLELVGIFLLAREVLIAHEMEEIAKDHAWAKQMNYLYAAEDYEGLYLLNRLDQGDSPERARFWLKSINSATAIKDAGEQFWGGNAERLARYLDRWARLTAPALIKRRSRYLKLGAFLLMLAAILHLVPEKEPSPPPPPPPGVSEAPRGWKQLSPSPAFAIGAVTYEEDAKGCPEASATLKLVEKWVDHAVEEWKRRGQPSSIDSLIVVGVADRLPLSSELRRRYDSNMGLARARAETIRARLVQRTDGELIVNRITPERVFIQVTGPGHTPKQRNNTKPQCSDSDLAKDRSVVVWIPVRPANKR